MRRPGALRLPYFSDSPRLNTREEEMRAADSGVSSAFAREARFASRAFSRGHHSSTDIPLGSLVTLPQRRRQNDLRIMISWNVGRVRYGGIGG